MLPTAHLANTFNGLNWRVTRAADLSKGAYNGLDEKRVYYYSAGWQMIEERVDRDVDTNSDSSGGADDDTDYVSQQIWGARYIDDAVAKRITEDSVSRVYFYLTDAMFSVRALADSSGRVVERIDYTPYGRAIHNYAGDVNHDGAVDFFDVSPVTTNAGGSTVLVPGDAGYDPDVDSNGDRMDFFDVSAFQAQYNAHGSSTVPSGWLTDPTDSSWTDNSIGYDGYHFDYAGATDGTASGVYCVRHRVYDPAAGRWLQRDPLGFVDSMSLYAYVRSNPNLWVDPFGLSAEHGIDHWVNRMQTEFDRLSENDKMKMMLFLLTQLCIIEKLDAGECDGVCGASMEDEVRDWLTDVVEDFMRPLIDSLDERNSGNRVSDPGWRNTFRNMDKRGPFGDSDPVPQTFRIVIIEKIKRDMPWLPGGIIEHDPHDFMYLPWHETAFDFAKNHINRDLQDSLLNNGIGYDAVWDCVGGVVQNCEEASLTKAEQVAGKVAKDMAPGLDVQRIRDAMRERVRNMLE